MMFTTAFEVAFFCYTYIHSWDVLLSICPAIYNYPIILPYGVSVVHIQSVYKDTDKPLIIFIQNVSKPLKDPSITKNVRFYNTFLKQRNPASSKDTDTESSTVIITVQTVVSKKQKKKKNLRRIVDLIFQFLIAALFTVNTQN